MGNGCGSHRGIPAKNIRDPQPLGMQALSFQTYRHTSVHKKTQVMKLSKSLLQAILVGITIGSLSACELYEDGLDEPNSGQAPNNQSWLDQQQHDDDFLYEDCPACGMG
jgi:hypothetical protein